MAAEKQGSGNKVSHRNNGSFNRGSAAVFNFLATVVEKFGWPGLLVLFAMYFVEKHATDPQKHEIIDMYVLGHGLSSAWPVVIVSVGSIAALFAQKRHYDRKLAVMSKRLDEIANEKSRLQEQLVRKRLQHADGV